MDRSSKASDLDKLMPNNATVCHADFHNHSIAITLNKFTEQLRVSLSQLKYQSQCLHLLAFTSPLFHHLPAQNTTAHHHRRRHQHQQQQQQQQQQQYNNNNDNNNDRLTAFDPGQPG